MLRASLNIFQKKYQNRHSHDRYFRDLALIATQPTLCRFAADSLSFKGVVAISDDKKYKIQNQQTSASKMLRNIDLEISKDHNSKNVPGETIFVPESFENKLLAPLGPEILRNLHPPFFHFFLWEADSKMLRNIGLEISKDHNSKNVSGDARAFHESFGIKLLAPLGPEILRNLHPSFFRKKKDQFRQRSPGPV